MMVYGGPVSENYRLIAEVENSGIRAIGKLPYNFFQGNCAKYVVPNKEESALLCGNEQADSNGFLDRIRCFMFVLSI